ncbi:MAG: ROK family protein [Eubacteriales bacterium]|nr:ROK family protein [Eubacteriales bacterium]
MAKKTNTVETKSENKQAVFRYILNHGTATKQDLYIGLGLSFPTIKQCMGFLEDNHLITPIEKVRNTGGRSATSYSVLNTSYYAIGVFISLNHITAVCVDLSGNIIQMKRFREPLNLQTESYLQLIGNTVQKVKEAAGVADDAILGIGLSVPSLVSEDGESIIYGMTTDFTGITREVLSRYIPYPTKMFHDSESAAIAETWKTSEYQNVIYFNLNNSIGSSIILDGKIYRGNHCLAGEIGHVIVNRNSKKKCYCGQMGCFDTECSASVLDSYTDGNLEKFFQLLSQKDEGAVKIWDTYLEYLSIMILNQKKMFDCSIIIGGYVGNHIEPYMKDLYKKIDEISVFAPNSKDYVFPCRYKQEATAAGAAIQIIDNFINAL